MSAHIRSLPPKNRVDYVTSVNTQKPNLLFVDDEERILRTLKMLFSRQYNVKVTTSGYDALEILKTENIHVLISDQRMPIMLGVDLLRQAKEVSPNTMRLLLTGYSDMQAIMGSINEGEIFRYINKPWDVTDIKSTINSAAEIALSLTDINKEPISEINLVSGCILVIDEDPDSAAAIDAIIKDHMPTQHHPHLVEWAHNIDKVLDILEHQSVALVISEARLGNTDLTDLVKLLKQYNPQIITILLTKFRDSNMLISMVNQAQIYRFLPKPLRTNLTWLAVKGGLERVQTLKAMPKLVARHTVDVKPKSANTENNPITKRLMGFFSRKSKVS